jgi:hypothetical protein
VWAVSLSRTRHDTGWQGPSRSLIGKWSVLNSQQVENGGYCVLDETVPTCVLLYTPRPTAQVVARSHRRYRPSGTTGCHTTVSGGRPCADDPLTRGTAPTLTRCDGMRALPAAGFRSPPKLCSPMSLTVASTRLCADYKNSHFQSYPSTHTPSDCSCPVLRIKLQSSPAITTLVPLRQAIMVRVLA